VLAEGKVSPGDLEIFRVTDDVDEAVSIMVEAREERMSPAPGGGKHPPEPHTPD
jgi:hypothetical protein